MFRTLAFSLPFRWAFALALSLVLAPIGPIGLSYRPLPLPVLFLGIACLVYAATMFAVTKFLLVRRLNNREWSDSALDELRDLLQKPLWNYLLWWSILGPSLSSSLIPDILSRQEEVGHSSPYRPSESSSEPSFRPHPNRRTGSSPSVTSNRSTPSTGASDNPQPGTYSLYAFFTRPTVSSRTTSNASSSSSRPSATSRARNAQSTLRATSCRAGIDKNARVSSLNPTVL